MNNDNSDNLNISEKAQSLKPRKKRRTGVVIFVVFLVLAISGATAYYFMQRQKPIQTVSQFLNYAQEMNIDGMSSLIQSKDISALENADLLNDSYKDFFSYINSKMTYEITDTDFDLTNGTAQVTAHITYIDGSEIFKSAISEFIRQTFSSAFAGKTLSEEEIQQNLSSLLMEATKSATNTFTATDITYPVILADNIWKIVSFDNETVHIMSANFKNLEDEVNNTLVNLETDAASSDSANATETLNLTTERFNIRYTQYRISNDFDGNPCLLLYYDYTNNSNSPSSAMVDVNILAYQNGETLSAAIPEDNEEAVDRFMSEIKPGETANVCQVFSLNGTEDVTLEATEAFALGGGSKSTQIVKVQ